jgi:hypothetical protein
VSLLSGQGGGFTPNYLNGTSNYYLFNSTGRYRAMVGAFNLTSNTATAGTYAGDVTVVDANSSGGGFFTGGLYTVTDPAWGRVAFQFDNNLGLNIVAYIQGGAGNPSPVTGVTVSGDSDAASGTFSFQANAATNYQFTDFAFPAVYSNIQYATIGLTTKVGVITFDGNNGYTGTVDVSGPFGMGTNLPISGSYTFRRNGVGSIDQSPAVAVYAPSSPPAATIYFINTNRALVHPVVSAINSP